MTENKTHQGSGPQQAGDTHALFCPQYELRLFGEARFLFLAKLGLAKPPMVGLQYCTVLYCTILYWENSSSFPVPIQVDDDGFRIKGAGQPEPCQECSHHPETRRQRRHHTHTLQVCIHHPAGPD